MLCTPHRHHSDNQIKKNEMEGGGGHIVRTGERKGAYRIMEGRPHGRWDDNIKTDPQKVG